MPDFKFENSFCGTVAGVDEAGRGPWVGPVVAGAVIFLTQDVDSYLLKYLNDSKKLSAKRREELFEIIKAEAQKHHLCYGIGQASAKEIDEFNILQASFLAMSRAVENLNIRPDMALIDGNRLPKNFLCPCQCLIKGDSLSYSVSAASIVAKVYRDALMKEMALKYPGYGFEKNAGYGTKDHINGLKKYGITPEHRKSFKPIKDMVA
ncbi:MAG: ribonuclease HII [Alphaproteobacteria bacterium]|nr:ribonuclease HII [Alphaproteobacteria bacterium]